MWRTNAEQTDGWEMPSIYSSKYKSRLTNNTGEWVTPVVCPHCHTPLSPYGGCYTCNDRWVRAMQRDAEAE